jgi:ATP-dependent protease HslVU (ClpYQ) peptidase subunit
MAAEDIAREALLIAATLSVYTNTEFVFESLPAGEKSEASSKSIA